MLINTERKVELVSPKITAYFTNTLARRVCESKASNNQLKLVHI